MFRSSNTGKRGLLQITVLFALTVTSFFWQPKPALSSGCSELMVNWCIEACGEKKKTLEDCTPGDYGVIHCDCCAGC